MKTFQCQNCKYEVEFRKLPDDYKCPKCGADKEYFVEKEKYKIPFLLLLYSLTIIMLIISGSFTISIIYNQQKIPHDKVQVGQLSMELIGQKDTTIKLYNTSPMSDEKAKSLDPFLFKLSNTGTYKLNYVMKLVNVPDNELEGIAEIKGKTRISNNKVKFSLIDTKTNKVVKQGFISDLENNIIMSGTMKARSQNSYALRLWIDKNVGNEDQNKFYVGRIEITAYEDFDWDDDDDHDRDDDCDYDRHHDKEYDCDRDRDDDHGEHKDVD